MLLYMSWIIIIHVFQTYWYMMIYEYMICESKIQRGPLSESSIFEKDLPGPQESLSEVVGILGQKARVAGGLGFIWTHADDLEYFLIGFLLCLSQGIFPGWLQTAYGE